MLNNITFSTLPKYILVNAADKNRNPEFIPANSLTGAVKMHALDNKKPTFLWYSVPCDKSSVFIESVTNPDVVLQVPLSQVTKAAPTQCGPRLPAGHYGGSLFTVKQPKIL